MQAKRIREFAVCLSLIAASAAASEPLPPFKDELFRYKEPVAFRDGGAFLDVPYDEARDIDRRDEVPERRVARPYVDTGVGRPIEETIATAGGTVATSQTGRRTGADLIVVFMHGRNGDRRLGMNDWTFGGNFNRLKNIVTRANGLYVTIDGGKLAADDAIRFAEALTVIADRSPKARIVLACGSMGGGLCWRALAQPAFAKSVSGLVLLGSSSTIGDLERVLAMRGGAALPLLLAQGSRDKVYSLTSQKEFYGAVRQRKPGYPLRFVAFDGGNHGTPIRMVDWRDTLNWLLDRP